MTSPALLILTGCTAVGKTEIALRWAEANNAEIISCDSLLFHKGMDIGTAKPTKAELARVSHHLVDILPVTESMDIARFVGLARAAAADIQQRGRRVVVTGGSGFYLKAFFAPVADEVEVAPELRAEINLRFEREGLGTLVAELRRLNPAGLGALDVMNPRRVTRALERCLASGETLVVLASRFASMKSPFADHAVEIVQLERAPEDLDARIARRVESMLSAGLVDEVRRLMGEGLASNPSASRAIGYRETIDFWEGRMTLADLAPAIVKNTRALVKKQRTWFRTQLPAHRHIDAATAEVGSL